MALRYPILPEKNFLINVNYFCHFYEIVSGCQVGCFPQPSEGHHYATVALEWKEKGA